MTLVMAMMIMNNEFCPRNCEYLSITEKMQDLLDTPRPHVCLKYDTRLYHLLAHPDLYRCDKCYEEKRE